MPAFVQVCILVATIAFVGLVTATIFALIRLGEAASRLTEAAQGSIAQVESVVLETRTLLTSIHEMVPPAQKVVRRFQTIGERAADLSTAFLDEIEEPVVTAVAVARGVRVGAARLMDRLTSRMTTGPSSHNGDETP